MPDPRHPMRPDSNSNWLQEAVQYQKQGRLAAAEALCQTILRVNPAQFEALWLLGVCARQRGRTQAALEFFQRASAIRPEESSLHVDCAMALRQLYRPGEALDSYDRALELSPDNAPILYNRGNVLMDLREHANALSSYERALVLRPDYVQALSNRGSALASLQHYAEALDSFSHALKLQADYAPAHAGRAFTLQQMKRYAEAAAGYAIALSLHPDCPWLSGNQLHCLMTICDWAGFESAVQDIASGISAGKPVVHPFDALAIPLSAASQRQCSEIHVRESLPARLPAKSFAADATQRRIRLGYFSADLYQHATANLMAGLFEQHDRSRFDVLALSFGPSKTDAIRRRLESAFDQFHDVGHLSDTAIADLAVRLGIDIAIDLKGFTQHARTGIFAQRVAPVQVNYLGYPGTMAANYMDYLIADLNVIPPEHCIHYSEKIVWLPNCYQVNDDHRTLPGHAFSRQAAGLPEQGFVFCCFNNNWKITPDVFGLWMQLLQRVPGSVLWLLEDTPLAAANLRRAAKQHGVAAGRLVFAPRMDLDQHLARHRVADLFLDTLPYNAHTTASDALWAGLPVITRQGETFASRVAASLLMAVGLPELIAKSADGYLALALELANDASRLAALRRQLADNRLTQPLFDTRLFARYIEAGYAAIWQRHQAGLPPDHIVVAA